MRILLVEGTENFSQSLMEILKGDNYGVDSVFGGQEALQYIRTEIYDLVILDTVLPGGDGIAVLRTIRAEHNAVPVMIIANEVGISDKVYGLDSGADDLMTRPFSVEELLARVRALTRRKGEIRSDSILFGDITLNRTNCELSSFNGKRLKLSLKEFQILDLLFQNPHQIITKERIIGKIWGVESNAEYNNVEVYISFIRKKFQYLGVKAEIRTTRGIGYSLEEEKCIKL